MMTVSARGPVDPVGSRREAREMTLGILYAADAQGRDLRAVLADRPVAPPEYAVELVEGLADRLQDVDALVGRFAEGWATDRMPVVDRALVRMAVFELLHRPDVPTAAILAEVVELAGDYSTERSSRFVNGVVAAVADEARGDEQP
ncbi:MAG: transcription antitermination factor NusB [Actinomycetota bacterium]|nr:transcription antitermination factor NusB [Actinomycetota bacterium]